MESLLHPLDLHPVESKTIIDKFAAVGILQVKHSFYLPAIDPLYLNVEFPQSFLDFY